MLKWFSNQELEQEDDKIFRWVAGPSVQAAAVTTWPRLTEGDDSYGTSTLWAR